MFNFGLSVYNEGKLFRTRVISRKRKTTRYRVPQPGAVYLAAGGVGSLRKKKYTVICVSSSSWARLYDGTTCVADSGVSN